MSLSGWSSAACVAWAFALCLLAALCLPAGVAHAVPTIEDKESARNLFRMGDEKYRAGDFDGALTSFTAADAIMNLPTTGLEVGRTLIKLGKLIEAREKLRLVSRLERTSDEEEVQTDARIEADKLYTDLEDDIPSLQVRLKAADGSEIDDFTVEVDGEPLRREAALLPRRVNPGRHRVVVRADGFLLEERKITVAVGQEFVLDVELNTKNAPAPAPVTAPALAPPDRAGNTALVLAVVMFAVGGASLVVGGTTGVLTLVEADELQESCPNKACPEDEQRQLDKTVTMSHVATGTLAAGGALVAVGVVALLVGDGDADGEAQALVIPHIGVGYFGIGGVF